MLHIRIPKVSFQFRVLREKTVVETGTKCVTSGFNNLEGRLHELNSLRAKHASGMGVECQLLRTMGGRRWWRRRGGEERGGSRGRSGGGGGGH